MEHAPLLRAQAANQPAIALNSTRSTPSPSQSNSVSRSLLSVPLAPPNGRPLQAKLTVTPANDVFEQEADRVAGQVADRIQSPSAAVATATQSAGSVQRDDMPGKDEKLQTSRGTALQRDSAEPPKDEAVQAARSISALQRDALPDAERDDHKPVGQAARLQRDAIPPAPGEDDKKVGQASRIAVQRDGMPGEDEKAQASRAGTIQRDDAPPKDEPLQASRTTLQRNEASAAGSAEGGAVGGQIESQLSSSRGGGSKLSPDVQGHMESAFGADFGSVRVHTDSRADEINRSINARAFTTGSDVYFRSGHFDTQSRGGQELLAHELTHVVQQGAAPASGGVQKKT